MITYINFYFFKKKKKKNKKFFFLKKLNIKKNLKCFQVEVQGTDFSEIDYDTVYEKATRNLRF